MTTPQLPPMVEIHSDVENPALALPHEYNAATAFLDGALQQGWGQRVAIRFAASAGSSPTAASAGSAVTYAELAASANRAGNALLALGVEMEQRVALLLYDSPEVASLFFGAIKIGAVPIPTNTSLRPQDYQYMLTDSRARVLVVEADLWPRISQLRRELPFLRHVVVVQRGGADAADGVSAHPTADGSLDYAALLAGARAELAAAPTTRDDAAFWLYSSGSTGFPKGCVHLQHDMHVCTELYAKNVLAIRPDDIAFSAAKLYFAYGLGNGLYFPLAVGASTVHFPGRITPASAFSVITEQRPTIFFGSPALFASMLALADAQSSAPAGASSSTGDTSAEQRFDTSSLRVCVSAGEALPADIYRRWRERFGVEILDGIGSTEILHIFISNVPGQVVPGSSGQLVPGYTAAIVDEQGQPVPRGEIGNLLIAGDSICSQYWNKHERTTQTMLGRWIQTGDKYYQDERGTYWYAGRSDDMLKVSGQWVSPVEVEAALITHPSVLSAAVVGRDDHDGLLKPQAFVVLKEGVEPSDALAAELQQYVKTTLLPHKYPRWVTFMSELPMTATGKIQRYRLRELLAEEAAGAAADGVSASGALTNESSA